VKALRSARGLATIAVAIVIAALTLWAGYFFDVGTIAHAQPDTNAPFANVRIPAPLYWVGLRTVKIHDELGHLSFLLGRYSERVAGGVAIVRARRRIEFVLMPLALMLFVLTSYITSASGTSSRSIRSLCVVAAAGVAALWRNVKGRVAAALLMAWLFAGVAFAHPDYLAWFNEFAGRHPEHIAVDSNLDWGQDIYRLGRGARRHHIERGSVLAVSSAIFMAHGYPAYDDVPRFKPVTGWFAVSETALALDPETPKGAHDCLTKNRPYERIGRSIRLYYVPP